MKAAAETGLRVLLFYQKSKDEGSDFYYMGDMEPADFEQAEILDKGEMVPIVDVLFHMEDEVEESIYQYLGS